MSYVPPRFEENKGLIHLQAKVGHKMAMLNGVHLDYEDWFQEASLAFVNAAAQFDPNAGWKFSAYFTKVCFSQFRKTIGQLTGVKNLNADQRAEIAERTAENKRRGAAGQNCLDAMRYGIHPISFGDVGTSLEDGVAFEETVPADTPTPEQALQAKQTVQRCAQQLSPLAQLVVEWLRDPPPELLREIQAQAAFADRCNLAGERAAIRSREGLCLTNIGQFLKLVGVEDVERALPKLRVELQRFVQQVEAA